MTLTSFYFLCMAVGLLIVYYLIPGRFQYLVLPAFGIYFYMVNNEPWLLLFPVVTGCICYFTGKQLEKKPRLSLLVVAVVICVGLMLGIRFAGARYDSILVPLGISYYTFSMLSYLIDIYYGTGKSAKNLGRFLAYGTYFPTLISGPIMNYSEMQSQMEEIHSWNYQNLTFGAQRILWGFFKKLVISERAALIVSTVFQNHDSYQGGTIAFGAVCFVIQLYTDFSGAMDIVLGLSQMLGRKLPENFKTPFFSTSIAEFWRRWHITLGAFMKNYVFYPLLRSSLFTRLSKKNTAWFGKKRGKRVTTYAAMFVLWFSVGIWHGPSWTYILGAGLIHFCYIVFEECTEPVFKKMWAALQIPYEHKILVFGRRLRTFLLVAFAFIFFRASSMQQALQMVRGLFSTWNPEAFVNGEILSLGLDAIEMTILFVSLLILLLVSIFQEKGIRIRERIAGCRLPVRWLLWYALLFYVIILGNYGPEFSASEFIYQGF